MAQTRRLRQSLSVARLNAWVAQIRKQEASRCQSHASSGRMEDPPDGADAQASPVAAGRSSIEIGAPDA